MITNNITINNNINIVTITHIFKKCNSRFFTIIRTIIRRVTIIIHNNSKFNKNISDMITIH